MKESQENTRSQSAIKNAVKTMRISDENTGQKWKCSPDDCKVMAFLMAQTLSARGMMWLEHMRIASEWHVVWV